RNLHLIFTVDWWPGKSQGLTLSKAVVDLGAREFATGLTYVAISRVKSLQGLMLLRPIPADRLRKKSTIENRLAEEARLHLLARSTLEQYQHLLETFDTDYASAGRMS